jgi:hypothetical protein
MKMQVRVGFTVFAALVALGLAGCDHYNCSSGANFAGNNCTASGSGLGTSGTGSATAALVYVIDPGTSGSTNGTMDSYTLNTSAETFAASPNYTAPTIPPADGGVGLVVAQQKYLYAGFGTTNQIYGWSFDSTGNLTTISGSPFAASFLNSVGGGFANGAMITNPAGTMLFIADLFQDNIYVYTIGTDGSLTAVTGSPFTSSFAPGNITTDGLGNYLYITDAFSNHTGSQIEAFTIGTTGTLTPVVGSPFAFPMWQVQGEPLGKYLIGTSGHSTGINGSDDDHLYVFSIAQSGSNAGALTPVSGSPFPTVSSPFSIAVQTDANGYLLYSFGINDTLTGFNSAEGYSIDDATGALSAVQGSPFSNAALGSVGQFDQSGGFLVTFGAVLDTSTNATNYQLAAFGVDTSGNLTQSTTTLDLSSAGFFTVTDPE